MESATSLKLLASMSKLKSAEINEGLLVLKAIISHCIFKPVEISSIFINITEACLLTLLEINNTLY
jgi:hypothetical protein